MSYDDFLKLFKNSSMSMKDYKLNDDVLAILRETTGIGDIKEITPWIAMKKTKPTLGEFEELMDEITETIKETVNESIKKTRDGFEKILPLVMEVDGKEKIVGHAKINWNSTEAIIHAFLDSEVDVANLIGGMSKFSITPNEHTDKYS